MALKEREHDVRLEKERKIRTSLTDHLLFAIVCDSKRVDKVKMKLAGAAVEQLPLVDEAVEEQGFDWTKQETIADQERKEKLLQGAQDEEQKEDNNPYDKACPFYNDQPLMIHRILKTRNYEYAFFVNEAGNRDIGVFIVLIEALDYKT